MIGPGDLRPTTADYVRGLRAIAGTMSPLQRKILLTQYAMPAHSCTASHLASAAAIRGGHPIVNLHYARLAKRLCGALEVVPMRRGDGSIRWWTVWSTGHRSADGFVWVMREEVAAAIRELGWTLDDEEPLPEEVRERGLFEGATSQVVVNAYERNPRARRRCIEHYGTQCVVCDFDFGEAFGEVGAGYIHVHHLTPLAQVNGEYEVDPVDHLRPVCPNCHAMIHLGGQTRSIEQVRALIAAARARRHLMQK